MMITTTRSSPRLKLREENSKERKTSTRESPSGGSVATPQEASTGNRRSSRESLGKKNSGQNPPHVVKSDIVEKLTPRKSESAVEKQNVPSPLRRSERAAKKLLVLTPPATNKEQSGKQLPAKAIEVKNDEEERSAKAKEVDKSNEEERSAKAKEVDKSNEEERFAKAKGVGKSDEEDKSVEEDKSDEEERSVRLLQSLPTYSANFTSQRRKKDIRPGHVHGKDLNKQMSTQVNTSDNSNPLGQNPSSGDATTTELPSQLTSETNPTAPSAEPSRVEEEDPEDPIVKTSEPLEQRPQVMEEQMDERDKVYCDIRLQLSGSGARESSSDKLGDNVQVDSSRSAAAGSAEKMKANDSNEDMEVVKKMDDDPGKAVVDGESSLARDGEVASLKRSAAHLETCSTSSKKERVKYDALNQGNYSNYGKRIQGDCSTSSNKDGVEMEANFTVGFGENEKECIQNAGSSADVWRDGDPNKCIICRLGGNVVSCGGKDCKSNYHFSCLNLPLDCIPPGGWYCPSCAKEKISLLVSDFDISEKDQLQNKSDGSIVSLKERLAKDNMNACKPESSRFNEYWVPVQISEIQLEQYCSTLLSNSLTLCSTLKNDPVGALSKTLISLRQCCDHPYVLDPPLQYLLNKDRKEVEYLEAGIKVCGKLQLLDAMLMEIKNQGLKVVVLFQSIGGARDLIGDILDDFVRQRFGPTTYERIDRDITSSKKHSATDKFNKEDGRFVLLLEIRACNPAIKLQSVDAFIIFNSNLSPASDLKALQKITLGSKVGMTKVFRLYTFCSVEEKVLLLAKQDKFIDSNHQNISCVTTHMLLMWGALYLFDKLNEFHNTSDSIATTVSDLSFLKDVLSEFTGILNETNSGMCNFSLILKATQKQGTYSTDYPLFGEQRVKAIDEIRSNSFWSKLLEGKNPKWKYITEPSPRNRKRARYFDESQRILQGNCDEVPKKRRKPVADSVNMAMCQEGMLVEGKDRQGSPRSGSHPESRLSPRATFSVNDTTRKSDATVLNPSDEYVSEVPQNLLVHIDGHQTLRVSQKSLHVLLKPEISKLYEVLNLSEATIKMADLFLDYLMNNHHVNREAETIWQAFQISVCWVAASLLKEKLGHKESIALAKEYLSFGCKIGQVDYIYSMLRCVKSLFLVRVGILNPEFACKPTEKSTESVDAGSHSKGNVDMGYLLQGQEFSTKKTDLGSGLPNEFQLVEKDLSKSIRDIQKKCSKQTMKLLKKYGEEKEDLRRKYEEEMKKLGNKKDMEAAVIRLHNMTTLREDKLKNLDSEYSDKLKDLSLQMEARLKECEEAYEAAKIEVLQSEETWVKCVRSWAQIELSKPFVNKPNHPLVNSADEGILGTSCTGLRSSKSCEDVLDCSDPINSDKHPAADGSEAVSPEEDLGNGVSIDPLEEFHIEGATLNGVTPEIVVELRTSDDSVLAACSPNALEKTLPSAPPLCENQVPDDVRSIVPQEEASFAEPQVFDTAVGLNAFETGRAVLSSQVSQDVLSQQFTCVGNHDEAAATIETENTSQRIEVPVSHYDSIASDELSRGASALRQVLPLALGDAQQRHNCSAQASVGAAAGFLPRAVFQYTDPFQVEMERIRHELDQTTKSHRQSCGELMSACEKEIEEVTANLRRKYEIKIKEEEAAYLQKKKELEANHHKVLMSRILGEAFRSKCMDVRAPAVTRMQPASSSRQHSIPPTLHHSIPPTLHHSIPPTLHHSVPPSLHHSVPPSLQHSVPPSLQHQTPRPSITTNRPSVVFSAARTLSTPLPSTVSHRPIPHLSSTTPMRPPTQVSHTAACSSVNLARPPLMSTVSTPPHLRSSTPSSRPHVAVTNSRETSTPFHLPSSIPSSTPPVALANSIETSTPFHLPSSIPSSTPPVALTNSLESNVPSNVVYLSDDE